MSITPNPDTNPELFELVPEREVIGKGSMFKRMDMTWDFTCNPGMTPDRVGYAYYRRKQPTESNNNMKWNPIANGNPTGSFTVIMTNESHYAARNNVTNLMTGYYDYSGWKDGKRNPIDAPKYWAELPTEVEPLKVQPIIIYSDGSNREVEILANGDIVVGCTTVPSETMDVIIERRKEKTK